MLKLGLLCCVLAGSALVHAAEAKGGLEVKIGTNGNVIAFDKKAIEVKAGSEVKIRFVNEASKESEILHNIAVIKPGSFDEVVKELQKNGYDIEKMRSFPAILTMTKSLAPGQEESLTFTPDKPGEYPYICLMAGHSDMLGMKGILKVVK